MEAYYYSRLNSLEKKCYDKILTSISQNESSVKLVAFLQVDSVSNIATAISYDHPEIFYVNFRETNCVVSSEGMVYYIDYMVKSIFRNDLIYSLNTKISKVLEELKIQVDDTEYDKCRKVHNYLINHIYYHYDALRDPEAFPEAFSIRGVFENSKAVCDGISKAFKLLGDRLGIESLIVRGISSKEGDEQDNLHAWNIVKVNQLYFHVDVTWDLVMSEDSKYIRYDYFFISDDWIKVDHQFAEFPICETNYLSYFERMNCLFTGVKALKLFLEKEIKNGAATFYFKIIGSKKMPDDITDKIQNLIFNLISQYTDSLFTMEMMPNCEQNIFFIRIIYD